MNGFSSAHVNNPPQSDDLLFYCHQLDVLPPDEGFLILPILMKNVSLSLAAKRFFC